MFKQFFVEEKVLRSSVIVIVNLRGPNIDRCREQQVGHPATNIGWLGFWDKLSIALVGEVRHQPC